MFRRLPDRGGAVARTPVDVTVDGTPVTAFAGDTVAAALVGAGHARCRTAPVSGAPRGPYCLMGVCFECLVTIDGVGNRQACCIRIEPGMVIETQTGLRSAVR